MRFPPFFIGAATIFWGFCAGWEYFSIVAALVFESSMIVKTRFDLKSADFIRISDLSSIVMLILLLYSYLENEPRMIFLYFITTTPIVFMPLLFAQLYSTSDKVVIGTKFGKNIHAHAPVDIRPLYLLMVFFATAGSDVRTVWFFAGTFILVSILFSESIRDFRSFLRYFMFSAVSIAITLSIAFSIVLAHKAIREKMMEMYRNWYNQQSSDPFKTSTAMGETGYLKLSGNIVMRVMPEKMEGIPLYLKSSDYNILTGNVWHSRSKDSMPVFPDGEMEWQLFGEGEGKRKASLSVWMGKNGKGVLSLPIGSKRALKMDVAGIEKTGLGSILVEEGPDLLEFVMTYDPQFRYEPMPEEKDLMIPDSEKEVIAKVMSDNLLKGETNFQTLENIERYFMNFSYTLQLEPSSGRSVLDDFLNRTKAGHCEYFATATTLMLRSAGIAARYSTGYSVEEYSTLERSFIVRARDAHAWVTAFVGGKWITVDTTPSQWRSLDRESKSFIEPVRDLLSWLRLQYENFRRQKNVEFNRALIVIATVLTLFMMIKIYIRRKRVSGTELKSDRFSGKVDGLDSPFYQVLIKCSSEGITKNDNETLRKWVIKNSEKLKDSKDIMKMIHLHEQLRFDPASPKNDIRNELQKYCDKWIAGES
ncbi:MAG TPA: transglutaminase-like domain-containing protein [bacterium]|nr:transglutaminase-like domain-containing protein [bacterium]